MKKVIMKEEIRSQENNKTWELIDLPPHKKSIGRKWVCKTKVNPNESIKKHKASYKRSSSTWKDKAYPNQYHFLRDRVNEGDIDGRNCQRNYQMTDIFTKPHTGQIFKKKMGELGNQEQA